MWLQVLDMSNNRISKVQHLQGLTQLEDLWLNDNQIPSLEGIEEALQDQVGRRLSALGHAFWLGPVWSRRELQNLQNLVLADA
jgi:Leucine-rich repeat (LRR) protein